MDDNSIVTLVPYFKADKTKTLRLTLNQDTLKSLNEIREKIFYF